MDVTIKNIKMDIFREFKAEAVRRGLKVGEAANEAFLRWSRGRRFHKDITRLKRAVKHIDATRTPSHNWSASEEIRRRRKARR